MSNKPSEPLIQAHNFEDFDELTENLQGWDLEFARLDRGPFGGKILQVSGEEFQFSSFSISCRHEQRGAPPPASRRLVFCHPNPRPLGFETTNLTKKG